MTLTLYFHPLASFCWKALIALYENGTPFEPCIVDLGDEASRAAFLEVWPMGKFPILRDEAADCIVAEATMIVEYIDVFYPGATRLVPSSQDCAWRTRMWDRILDHYVHEPMQKIVTDRLRPEGMNDPYGVEQAKAQIEAAYALIDRELELKRWMMGDAFTLADCAAAPALLYAEIVVPFSNGCRNLPPYLDRLMARASFARVLKEAEPYFPLFPMETKPGLVRAGARSSADPPGRA